MLTEADCVSKEGLRQTVAALGVIASMVFVGLEIRQNRLVAQAMALQQYSAMSMQVHEALYTDPLIRGAVNEYLSYTPEDLPDVSVLQENGVAYLVRGLLRFHESVWLQVERGLLDEADLQLYAFRNQAMYQAVAFPLLWELYREDVHPDFATALSAEYGLPPP